MIEVRYFQKDGSCNWEVKVSAIVIAVVAVLVLGCVTGENTAAWIVGLFGR